VLQYGFPDTLLQSASIWHAPDPRHALLAQASLFGQSELTSHWTQAFVFVLQTGRPEKESQSLFCRHCTHWSVSWSHTALPVTFTQDDDSKHVPSGAQVLASQIWLGQSESCRHCSHIRVAALQTGLSLGQSLFCSHCTHRFVFVSQAGVGAAQSLLCRHGTHWWMVVLQTGSGAEQSLFERQSPGMSAQVLFEPHSNSMGQSLFCTHWTHTSVTVLQAFST
jgi:hypothetical protein